MYTIDAAIRGTAPFLYNRYTEKARAGKLRKEELLEEATRRVYRNDAGELIVPRWNLKRCLMDGAQRGEVKHGKKSIVPYFQALVVVDGDPSFGTPDYDRVDEHLGRIPPRTGPMVMLYRPLLETGWRLTFRLLVADTTIHPDTVRQIVTFAGVLVGLGAWRPEYGRFVLDAFVVAGLEAPSAPVVAPPKAAKRRTA